MKDEIDRLYWQQKGMASVEEMDNFWHVIIQKKRGLVSGEDETLYLKSVSGTLLLTDILLKEICQVIYIVKYDFTRVKTPVAL